MGETPYLLAVLFLFLVMGELIGLLEEVDCFGMTPLMLLDLLIFEVGADGFIVIWVLALA